MGFIFSHNRQQLNNSKTMDNDTILQTLTDAFEVLKDSWRKKKEALIHCIVETEAYDGDVAMSMWQYILQKNQSIITNKKESEDLISEVLNRFCDKYYGYYRQFSGREDIRTMLDHVAPHMIRNEEVIKLIFEKAYNVGYHSSYVFFEKVSCLICSILLQDSYSAVQTLINSLINNKNMKDVSIGMVLRDTLKYLEEVSSNSELSEMYAVKPETRELLINSLDLIKDSKERADCTITILSL